MYDTYAKVLRSLSARRAWIEIGRESDTEERSQDVALRKESVDRNVRCRFWVLSNAVALRKESVDRNAVTVSALLVNGVALRKESVDRNKL